MGEELKNGQLPDSSVPGADAQPEASAFRAIVAEEPAVEEPVAEVSAEAQETVAEASAEAIEEQPAAEASAEQPTELVDPVGAQSAETAAIPPTDPASLVQPTSEMPTAFEQPQPTTRMEVPATSTPDAFDAQPQSVYAAQMPAADYTPGAANAGEATYADAAAQQAAPVDAGYQQGASAGQSPYYAPPIPPTPALRHAVHTPVAPDVSYQPVAPLAALTGGMKFGWLVVGFLLGIPGMVIAWLVNNDKHPQVKKDAIMWSVVGFAIQVVVGILLTILLVAMMAAAYSNMGPGSGYYGGIYY